MIEALFWNEWRQKRQVFGILAAVTIVWWLVLFGLGKVFGWKSGLELALPTMIMIPPFLYGLVMGMSSFREISEKWTDFLLGLPVTPSRIYWDKYGSGSAGMLLLCALNGMMLWSLWQLEFHAETVNGIWGMVCFMTLLALLIHAGLFIAPLFGRGKNCVVYILWLVLAFLAASVWSAAGGVIWCGSRNVLEKSILFPLLMLLSFMVLTGWRLWQARLVVGKSPLPTALRWLGCWVGLGIMVYGISSSYARYRFDTAEREAVAAGLFIDYRKFAPSVPETVPEQQNAATYLKKIAWGLNLKYPNNYRQNYSLASDEFARFMASLRKNAGTFYTPKEIRETDAIIAAIISCPYFIDRTDNLPAGLQAQYGPLQSSKIYCLCQYLFNRAIETAMLGHNREFRERLDRAVELAQLYDRIPYANNRRDRITIELQQASLAVSFGATDRNMQPYYRRMLEDLGKINLRENNPPRRAMIQDELNNTPSWLRWLRRPYLQCLAAEFLRLDRQEKILVDQAEKTATYPEIVRAVETLRKTGEKNFLPGRGFDQVRSLFYHRTLIAACKLSLALKIYRIEHGVFPEKLSELVPSILSEIPVDALTGKAFIYLRQGDGFTLEQEEPETSRPRRHRRSLYLSYTTNNIPMLQQGEK